MPSLDPWSVLNIAAWGLGVKAVHDLRLEFSRQAKTWFFLDWGVRSCLIMEAALFAGRGVGGLALVSVVSGIGSALLMWLGFQSLQADVCHGRSGMLVGVQWDRALAWSLSAASAALVLGAWAFPSASDLLVRSLIPFQGALWLAASAWLGLRLSTSSCPAGSAKVFRPSEFSLCFGFAFLHAALVPFSRLTGIPVRPDAGALLGALFALSLVWTLATLLIRIRSHGVLEAQRELHSLNERLLGIEKLVTVSTLAAGAAHDFNNVLTAILGLSELGRSDPAFPERARRDFKDIHASALAAKAISAQLMGIARHGAGNGQYSSLKEAVEQPLEMLAKEFFRRGISVIKRIEEVPPVAGDLGQIAQVCLNLYLNARDAMIAKSAGVLTVTIGSKDGEVEIAVSDTGTGIADSFRPKIFQALQSTKGEKGTGLGLSASHSVIASLGGRLTFESKEGEGTTFIIRLPTRRPA